MPFPSKCSTSTNLSTNGKGLHPIANIEPAVALSAKDGGYVRKNNALLDRTPGGHNQHESCNVIQVKHSDVSLQNVNDVSLDRMPSSITLEQPKEVKPKIVPTFTSRFRHIGSKTFTGNSKQNSSEQAGKNKENLGSRREFSEGKVSTSDGNVGLLYDLVLVIFKIGSLCFSCVLY